MSIQTTKLNNGLRIVTDHVPSVGSVALGVWVGVGTRNENMAHNGIAHMVEHMLFKGTKNRNSKDIVEQIENVGGSMNAYTSREVTSYHMHMLADDMPLGLEVLSDMLQHSTMPEEEVERERHVILQEIGMCNDTPDDLVFDHYHETAYPKQALGAPILGTNAIIENMQRDTLMDYVRNSYTPKNLVISAAGAVDHDRFVKQVEQQFAFLPDDQNPNRANADYKGGEHRSEKELEQSHVILGFRGISRLDDDFYAAQALSAIFGGGMSSRLFQEVREKRGLVYSVFSFHSSYSDDGQFGIYAGTGPKDLTELVPVICGEIEKLASTLTDHEVERAKTQMRSSLIMGRESMMNRADGQAKYMLFRDALLDIDKIRESIDTLDKAKLVNACNRIFTSTPTLAALGPLAKLESYDSIKGRLGSKLAA